MNTVSSPYAQRLAAVRRHLAEWGVQAVLISSAANRRWLTGFTGSWGFVLVSAEQALLATDFRYWEQARQQAPDFTLFQWRRNTEKAMPAEFLAQAGVNRVGLEANDVTLAAYETWRTATGIDFTPLKSSVEPLRAVKTQFELGKIRAAAAITDRAMQQMQTLAQPGLSERQLAWALEKAMREDGASGMAFDVIVASGPNAALPHHHPGERQLEIGDAIVIDMGAELDGYHSDLTRTFFLGSDPTARFREVYHLVWQAQEAALRGLRAGLTGQAADALARDVITAAGHGEQFGHSLGHGVGLEIHEEPRLAASNDKPLPERAVVTVEPGVYIPGWGGVRIEDLVVLTADGLEMLSACPKTPVIDI